MSETHLEALLDAVHRCGAAGLSDHMSDTVVLRGPILPQPFESKAVVGKTGLHGLSKALARGLGPKGIAASTVAPRAFNTQRDWRQG